MARNQDNYDPNNTVAPGGGVSSSLTTKASPQEMGGQVAQAVQGFGQTVEKVADDRFKIGLQEQGLANEHAATVAEQQLAIDGGKIYDQYKSMTGLDAANSKDKAVNDYVTLSNKIREGLGNPAAQRAYDQMATRRVSFAVQDMNSYAATQRKDAYKNGRLASITLAKEEASRPEVAGNPIQFNDSLASVIFSTNDIFTNPDYGLIRTIEPKTDPKTGLLQYDTSTPDGRVAQKTYDAYIQKESGDVFTNAAKTLAVDNPMKAHDFIESNKSRMSAATYANLSHAIAPAVQAEHTRKITDDIFNNFTANYQDNPTSTPVDSLKTLFPGIQVTSTKRTPEENAKLPGSSPTSNHLTGNAVDFVAPAGVSLEDVKAKLTAQGYNIIEAIDQKDDPKIGEKAHYHISWEPKISTGDYVSYSNALGMHAPELIAQARQQAKDQGLDLTAQDQAESRMQTRINHVLSAENVQNRANEDDIVRDLYAGKFPNQETLDKDPRFQLLNSRNSILAGNIVTRIMPAMAKGMQSGYGNEFYKHFLSSLEGNEDLTHLSNYVGQDKNSPVTNSGFQFLTKYAGTPKPEDAAFNKAFVNYLNTVHGEYTGSKQFPGSISKTESTPLWETVLQEILPRVIAGKASGKTANDLFNPNSKDYVHPGVKPPTLAQIMAINTARTLAGIKKNVPQEYGSLDELKDKIGTGPGKISWADAKKYGQQKGWIAPDAPSATEVFNQTNMWNTQVSNK